MIITRKIQIAVYEKDNDLKSGYYDQLHKWRFICRQAANIISSHLYTQDNIKEYVYLTEEIKAKLANVKKDDQGILTTSYQNTCYQVLSKRFKGEIPMDVMSNLNQAIQGTYKEEKQEYYKGERSLRSYRKSLPIPFSSRNLTIAKCDNEVHFTLYKIPFIMLFGHDRSGNKTIVDRIIDLEYKFRNSSITYDLKKKKWFLLLCVDIPKNDYTPKKGKEVLAWLSIDIPILLKSGKNNFEIGSKEEFLYQRLQIQEALRRLQKNLRYVNGGKGRKNKLAAIDRFHKKEKNYVTTKMHTYSRILIQEAKRQHAESIILIDQDQSEEEAKNNPFVLRNWSYYGLRQMIEYKAKREGIIVTVQKEKVNEDERI